MTLTFFYLNLHDSVVNEAFIGSSDENSSRIWSVVERGGGGRTVELSVANISTLVTKWRKDIDIKS